ncbi:hypothetical protein ACFWBN_11985 [Streptomyces sp. NPDC059989]|uniref:hypothetical protein n=1 Tax=Streptomyces sp. NPDC059989 TaxID=3347026 RepID=UPI0036BCF83C
MGIVDAAAKTAGKARDTAYVALGGKNGSGLEYKIVEAKGVQKIEVKAPEGYIVTGGGWNAPSCSPGPSG